MLTKGRLRPSQQCLTQSLTPSAPMASEHHAPSPTTTCCPAPGPHLLGEDGEDEQEDADDHVRDAVEAEGQVGPAGTIGRPAQGVGRAARVEASVVQDGGQVDELRSQGQTGCDGIRLCQ